MNFLNALPEGYKVAADAAYRGLGEKIMHPFVGRNLPPDQFQFNQNLSAKRQVIERTIGATEIKWRILQLKENRLAAKTGIGFACDCVIAACVLHNRFTNFLS